MQPETASSTSDRRSSSVTDRSGLCQDFSRVLVFTTQAPIMYTSVPMNGLSIRGAAAFGLPAIILFGLALTTSQPQTAYMLAAGPLCGIAGGLAFGRRWGLPIVLALSFGFVGAMFFLQDGRSASLVDVVLTGFVSAFLFWTAGICATLTLPVELRFAGANAFALPGGIAGMAFQFFYGPARLALNLGSRSWWVNSPWEHLIMWLVAGAGTGWLLGAELNRLQRPEEATSKIPRRSSWAVASVVCGLVGSAAAVVSFGRYKLPLGLVNSLSPATAAADWLRSWGLLTIVFGTIALIQTFRKVSNRYGRSFAITGTVIAVALLSVSQRIGANPWKARFNSNYAQALLLEHGNSSDPESGNAIYTGNLILAQAALDNGDVANAGRYLLEAAKTTGAKSIQENGPDTSVARALLQRGERDAVVEYLTRFRELWPKGSAILTRWETAIRAGRQPNFNNRAIIPPDTSPERR